jgi:hypothetical protein
VRIKLHFHRSERGRESEIFKFEVRNGGKSLNFLSSLCSPLKLEVVEFKKFSESAQISIGGSKKCSSEKFTHKNTIKEARRRFPQKYYRIFPLTTQFPREKFLPHQRHSNFPREMCIIDLDV